MTARIVRSGRIGLGEPVVVFGPAARGAEAGVGAPPHRIASCRDWPRP